MPSKNPAQTPEWKALQAHLKAMKTVHMRDLFAADSERFEKFHAGIQGALLLDYSKHIITDETLELLAALARACDFEQRREDMFAGKKINTSENRAALHTALRGGADKNLVIEGENVAEFVSGTLSQIRALSDKIRADRSITDIIHIGIGGSDLGPRMACEALKFSADGPRVHFVANMDSSDITDALHACTPENTLVIIASKTFTTLETITNAKTAKNWIGDTARLIAITENTKAAADFGVHPENILPMRGWIGGRYSIWSSIGLALAIRTGFAEFEKFLDGAAVMDRHFRETPLTENIPVLMALLGIWYRNFMDFRAVAVLPYAENLCHFPAYLQQLDMESNGKGCAQDGSALSYAVGPVVFGGTGSNAQHAFMQLFHQGGEPVPCDFILFHDPPVAELRDQHSRLLAGALAQSQALMQGMENSGDPHRHFPGNRPSSTLLFERLDARNLGMLMALYEHKIFTQGAIWNINSFDQPGVELGKTLAGPIAQALESRTELAKSDSSTTALVKKLQNKP